MANVISNNFSVKIDKQVAPPVEGFVVSPTSFSFSPMQQLVITHNQKAMQYCYLYGFSGVQNSVAHSDGSNTYDAQPIGTYKNCYLGSYINDVWTQSNTFTVTITSSSVSVTGVTLNKSTLNLSTNATEQLTATVSPSNATNKNVSFSSSNTNVATVSSSGLVTAKTSGSCTVTVTTADGNKTATCNVTVANATVSVTSVSLNKTSHSFSNLNETVQLTATVSPSNATNKNVTWSSSNNAIATVNSSGVVTSKATGTCTITVTTADGNKTATCNITVPTITVNVSSVSLNKTSHTFSSINGTVQLSATVNPSNATNKNVAWASSNTAIATVSSSGLVTSKGYGSCTITVSTADGNKTATCNITVQSSSVSVTSVTLNRTSHTFNNIGDVQQLTATVNPSNATNKTVTWSSNRGGVASVSSSGLVTAKSVGSCTITASTVDGNKTATCDITVSNATIDVSSISLNKSSHTFSGINSTLQLTPTILPSNASNKGVRYSSSNTSIATVDANGLVTSKAKGSCTITATSLGNASKIATCATTVEDSAPGTIPNANVKPKLLKAKTDLDNAHNNLKSIINSATTDSGLTVEERTNISNAMATYNTCLATYSTVSQESIEAIAERKKLILEESTNVKLSQIKVTTDGIEHTVSDLDGKYTQLKQTVDGFDFTGLVTFNDLSSNNGQTVIHGGNIRSGVISGVELKTSEPSSSGGVWIKQNGMQIGTTSVHFSDGRFKIEAQDNISISSASGGIYLMPNTEVNVSRKLSCNTLFVNGVQITGNGGVAVFG